MKFIKKCLTPVDKIKKRLLIALLFLLYLTQDLNWSGSEVIEFFSCSTQLNMIFILLINVEMPKIVDILILISRMNTTSDSFTISSHKYPYVSP